MRSDADPARQIRERAIRSHSHEPEAGPCLVGKFVRPGHQRSPDDLIDCDDHREHRQHAEQLGEPIAALDREAHIRTEAVQPKVVLPQYKSFAHHQKEPAARHRHHAVPEQARHGE
jgi:hypothetical protein